MELGENLSNDGDIAYNEGSYYAAASYCYGANVQYQYLRLLSNDYAIEDLMKILNQTQNRIWSAEDVLEEFDYETITDLQTYLIVKERLKDSQDHLNSVKKELINRDEKRAFLAARHYADSRVHAGLQEPLRV